MGAQRGRFTRGRRGTKRGVPSAFVKHGRHCKKRRDGKKSGCRGSIYWQKTGASEQNSSGGSSEGQEVGGEVTRGSTVKERVWTVLIKEGVLR